MTKVNHLTGPLNEMTLVEVASIMGESSASHRALDDALTRREKGETVAIFQCRKTGALMVGPCPPELLPETILTRE